MLGNKEARILNDLIETTLDSVKGYRMVAERIENSKLQHMFAKWAHERDGVVKDLQAEMRRLNKNPKENGSILGAAHRSFISFTDALSNGDDMALISEVERGENHLKSIYNGAIKDTDLNAGTIGVINDAYEAVRSGYDHFHRLKKQAT